MLLLCLILTLYGKRYYKQFFDANEIFEIQQYKKKLEPWINWKRN